MPLPLLAWAAIGATGLFGAAKTLDAVIDNDNAKDINKEANSIVERAKERITSCKDASGKSLHTNQECRLQRHTRPSVRTAE